MDGTRKRLADRMNDFRDAAQLLFGTLVRMGIAYAVGGSIASSLHGIARATQDLDVVVGLGVADVAKFHAYIRKNFYADDEAMRDAIRRGMCFNAIHLKWRNIRASMERSAEFGYSPMTWRLGDADLAGSTTLHRVALGIENRTVNGETEAWARQGAKLDVHRAKSRA